MIKKFKDLRASGISVYNFKLIMVYEMFPGIGITLPVRSCDTDSVIERLKIVKIVISRIERPGDKVVGEALVNLFEFGLEF